MKLVDELIASIKEKKSPIVIGLDPMIDRIPTSYIDVYKEEENEFKKIANIIYDFNKDIIDVIYKYVPAVKPQIAFYEMYGSYGIRAFEQTIAYAKSKGLIVIEDGKRNDIGNTATAYSNAHLGEVATTTGKMKNFDVDFLTVSPYLGYESLTPFIDVCKKYDKGVFILVKTSNTGNATIQDVVTKENITIAQTIAKFIAKNADEYYGESGYSSIGAVVGATYPAEAKILRELMPKSLFLVPGYGTQGADAKDIVPCFNEDGLGAIVNAARSVIFGYEKQYDRNKCSKEEYQSVVEELVVEMQKDIYNALKSEYPRITY